MTTTDKDQHSTYRGQGAAGFVWPMVGSNGLFETKPGVSKHCSFTSPTFAMLSSSVDVRIPIAVDQGQDDHRDDFASLFRNWLRRRHSIAWRGCLDCIVIQLATVEWRYL